MPWHPRSPLPLAMDSPFNRWNRLPISELPSSSLNKRSPGSTSSGGSATPSCVSTQASDTCEKPANNTAILPIALGVSVPVLAIIFFVFLHRRYRKRLRQEDKQDAEKYKSMDFGMDLSYQSGKGKKGKTAPEMSNGSRKDPRQLKGLSLDPGSNPFFFANAELGKASTDSLLDDHRYKLGAHSRSNSPALRGRTDTDSTLASPNTSMPTDSKSHLLRNPQADPVSYPQRGESMSSQPVPNIQLNEKALPPIFQSTVTRPEPAKIQDGGLHAPSADVSRDSYFDKNVRDIRQSNNYLRDFIHVSNNSTDERVEKQSEPSDQVDSAASTMVGSTGSYKSPVDSMSEVDSLPPVPANAHMSPYDPPTQPSVETRVPSLAEPPRHESFEASLYTYHTNSMVSDTSNFTDILRTPRESSSTLPPVPSLTNSHPPRGQSLAAAMPVMEEEEPDFLTVDNAGPNPERLSVLLRPLPEVDPTEDPEQRANRIRSFYKEYFDDSKPYTSHVPLPEASTDYYEDYGSEYQGGGTVFDAQTGTFVMAQAPYAEPVTRRAMTPPPRAPPRFQSAPRSRTTSNSTSNYGPAPRGFSAMSHRGRAPARRPMPPPAPLTSLPTPHLLKDDAAIFGAMDFAPPVSYRERQQGRRPDSPLGVQRPYSPAVRAHVPLASSFEDLNHIPSPHALRNSSAFTSLDFAAPPRFRNADNFNDASSMRSGRSASSSAQQVYNIRAGAYRVSRLPGQLAGTKDDIMAGLKPTWDPTLRGPA